MLVERLSPANCCSWIKSCKDGKAKRAQNEVSVPKQGSFETRWFVPAKSSLIDVVATGKKNAESTRGGRFKKT